MKRRLNNFFKSTAALMLAGAVVLGGSKTVSAETYTWSVYNNGPGAVRETEVAELTYKNSWSHIAQADSYTSTSEYNSVKLTGYTVYLYDVAEGHYKDYYRLVNTTSCKTFRPVSKTDETLKKTQIIVDTSHCYGTYAMFGRIWN